MYDYMEKYRSFEYPWLHAIRGEGEGLFVHFVWCLGGACPAPHLSIRWKRLRHVLRCGDLPAKIFALLLEIMS